MTEQKSIFDLLEEEDLSKKDRTELKKIIKKISSKKQNALDNDSSGLVSRIMLQQAKTMLSAEREKKKLAKERSEELKQIPLPISFDDNKKVFSNLMIRSSLFAAIKSKDREYVKDKTLVSLADHEVKITGEMLTQHDLDLLTIILHHSKGQTLDKEINISTYRIISDLNLTQGANQHHVIKSGIKRLVSTMITIKNLDRGINYYGHFFNKAIQDENNGTWIIEVNPDLAVLFDKDCFSYSDWEIRVKKLKRKDLAKFLMTFYSSHAKPYPMKVSTLRDLSGNKSSLSAFRFRLKNALTMLEDVGFINSWTLNEETDIIEVKKVKKIDKQGA